MDGQIHIVTWVTSQAHVVTQLQIRYHTLKATLPSQYYIYMHHCVGKLRAKRIKTKRNKTKLKKKKHKGTFWIPWTVSEPEKFDGKASVVYATFEFQSLFVGISSLYCHYLSIVMGHKLELDLKYNIWLFQMIGVTSVAPPHLPNPQLATWNRPWPWLDRHKRTWQRRRPPPHHRNLHARQHKIPRKPQRKALRNHLLEKAD